MRLAPGIPVMTFKLESAAFQPNTQIPQLYTGEGGDLSPPLRWSGAPLETKTYALIAHDPGASSGDFTHWVVFNIPAVRSTLLEGCPHRGDLSDGTVQGRNDFDRTCYGGPRPPPGEAHYYHFELFALDNFVTLEAGADRKALEQSMKGHIVAQTALIGMFCKV